MEQHWRTTQVKANVVHVLFRFLLLELEKNVWTCMKMFWKAVVSHRSIFLY
jgi:hypothetical protein